MNNDMRTVLGIIENNTFSTANGNCCSYVDIAFEKFQDEENSRLFTYNNINMTKYFSDVPQVFLTSDADSVLKKFSGQLVEMEVGESPNQNLKCKYTVNHTKIRETDPEAIIEIIKAPLPNMSTPVVISQERPSTSMVMLDTNAYELSKEEIPFINCIDRMLFNTEQEAKDYLRKQYIANVNQVPESPDEIELDEEVLGEISCSFMDAVNDAVSEYIRLYGVDSEIDREKVADLVKKNVNTESSNFDEYIDSIFSDLKTQKDKWDRNKGLSDEEKSSENEKSLEDYNRKIRTKRVLIGPFVVKNVTTIPHGGYEFVISVPDRGNFKTRDDCNATTRRLEYANVEEFVKKFTVGGEERNYIVQIKNWQNSGDKLDVIDDKKLVEKYCAPILNTVFKDIKPQQMQVFRTNLMNMRLLKNTERSYRALDLIAVVSEYEQERQKLFTKFSNSKNFVEYIQKYINDHVENILAQYAGSRKKEVDQKIKTFKTELDDIQKKINLKKAELNKLEKDVGKLSAPAFSERIKQQKTVSNEEFTVLKSKYNELQNQYSTLDRDVKSLGKVKEKLHSDLTGEIEELDTRYLEMHSMLKAFTSMPKSDRNGFCFESPKVENLNLDNMSKSRNRYVEELSRVLRGMGRVMDREKLISLIVTIAQNQFTILAGLPGSGKTSFVKCMGRALNLGSRLHTIPVARGWTSQRDILGYWNSLAGTFQTAPTGLWELMNTLDAERDPAKVTPAFLLLDEMNLSSPEHYFSSFMDLADGESERMVFTGCPEKSYLKVPEYFHFIGTVNSDDTVNIMSPRMLDRSAVVLFDEMPSQEQDLRKSTVAQEPMKTYSAKDWQTLFQAQGAISNTVYSVLNDIESTLYDDNHDFGQRVVISYRKHQQILNFCSVVCEMIDSDIAIDQAVKQFVLPMLSGMGEGFGRRLESLNEILTANNLKGSSRLLENMITEGADRMNSYQFLA